jgi:hypothetical protein
MRRLHIAEPMSRTASARYPLFQAADLIGRKILHCSWCLTGSRIILRSTRAAAPAPDARGRPARRGQRAATYAQAARIEA